MKIIFFFLLLLVVSCKTKSELRREQEFEKMQQTLKEVRTDRADIESLSEENRQELARVAGVLEGEALARRKESEEIRKELSQLSTRVQAIEQRIVAEELAQKNPPPEPVKNYTYEMGKKLFDEGSFEEASEVFRNVMKNNPKSEEAKKSQYLLAESLFSNKDFASAALEFGEFRKSYPKDTLHPNAIYRQAQAFRMMGKKQEAKLFFQDLIDRFPKSNVAIKAKTEIKKLK